MSYNLYCYYGLKAEPSKYKAGQDVEIDVPITPTGATMQNTQVGGEDVMVDNGKNQFWVHESIIKNNHIIARAKICFASGKSYMVQIFNRQFWIEEKNIKKVF